MTLWVREGVQCRVPTGFPTHLATSTARGAPSANVSRERNLDSDVALRVVRLPVLRAVFGPELVDHVIHPGGVRHGRGWPGVLGSTSRQADRGGLQHVLVPVA